MSKPGRDRQAAAAAGAAAAGEPLGLLSADGGLADGAQAPPDEWVLEALRWMTLSRTVDRRATSLQRQGRFGTFSAVSGQEASVVGSAMALDPARDWVVPQYRELPALLRQGLPLENFLLYFKGNPAGARIPDGVRILPIQIALAAQLPHAVGLGWGMKLQGSDGVALVYFGDGASSEGDFHEACNMAGVLKAPVIFFLQNNGWAISTPRASQSAAASFASRAEGYGITGAVVDGNDLLAVHQVTAAAVARARAGEGPTLIESRTFRMGAHNTADDHTRYMPAEALEEWGPRDPVARVQAYLRSRGAWDAGTEERFAAEADAAFDRAWEVVEATAPPSAEQLFAHVYATVEGRLAGQRAERLAGGSP